MVDQTQASSGAQPSLPPCKLCDRETAHFLERNGFEIVKCRSCGFMFAALPEGYDLNAVYRDDAYWTGGIDYGYTGGFDGYWRAVSSFYQARIARIRSLGKPGRLLEIGCADGRFLTAARAQGFEVAGVELSETMRERCLRGLGCPVYRSLDEVALNEGRFDCVVMFEVIEHLAEPVAALRAIRELMLPGAVLALSTPNFDSQAAVLAPGRFAPFSPPAHVCYFGPATLSDCVEQAGFETAVIEGCFALQEIPLPEPIGALLRPFRRGKRLLPHGVIGKLLKAYLRRRALAMARRADALRLAETLELYALRP